MFLDVAYIQLIYNLISEITALQRALVMMQVSGQCFPLFVSVIMFFFTFEVQSRSSANIPHVFGHFCSVGFGIMELLMYKMFRNS